jgi:uncharacterized protein YukE
MGRYVVADNLRVDARALHIASDHISVAADDHATETASHQDDLTDAASRWRGESKAALHELAQRWEAQDTAHHSRVTALGNKVSEAAQRYASTDRASGQAIESTPIIGSDDEASGPVPDMGI